MQPRTQHATLPRLPVAMLPPPPGWTHAAGMHFEAESGVSRGSGPLLLQPRLSIGGGPAPLELLQARGGGPALPYTACLHNRQYHIAVCRVSHVI